MSAWRLIARELYQTGRQMASTEFMDGTRRDVFEAAKRGIVQRANGTRAERGGNVQTLWELTPLGRDWCEGRAVPEYRRPGGYQWVATWLRALPVGLRIVSERIEASQ